ncbi:MAG: hypothetical protein ABW199_12710 [Caulobacterales bacterium]
MPDFAKLFDSYNRQARLYPSLIAILPALIVVLLILPTVFSGNIGAVFLGIIGSTGLLFYIAEAGRSLGKRAETELLVKWGGWPTTIWLRHESEFLSRTTRGRYLAKLGERIPNLQFPTPESERHNPRAADELYASAVDWLKEQARGPKYRLVAVENAAYGFRRNLFGLKAIGVLISVVAILSIAALIVFSWPKVGWEQQNAIQVVAGIAVVFILLAWLWLVNEDWVRQAADAYARALLACCENI